MAPASAEPTNPIARHPGVAPEQEQTTVEPTLPAHCEPFSLRIIDADEAGQRLVPLREGLTLVGSRPGCRVRLRSSRVSPVHCAIITTPDRAILRDLASETGTSVNDWEADDCFLSAGDRVQIGRWRFAVETAGAAADAPDEHPDDTARCEARDDDCLCSVSQQIELRDVNDESLLRSRGPVVLIGRHRRCDLALHDHNVSRAHALLFHTADGWGVADLLSANGTQVNDRAIDPQASNAGTTLLANGDVLRVGPFSLTVHIGGSQDLCDSQGTVAKELEERETVIRNRETDLEERERSAQDRAARLNRDEQYNARLTSELEASTAEVQERSAELDTRYREFEAKQEELAERVRRTDELRRELDRRQEEIAAGEEDLARRVAGAAKAIDLCKQRSRELDARAARIDAGQENMEKERIAHDAVARALAQREEQARQTEVPLAGRERQLQGRESALVERERGIERGRESLAAARAELGEREQRAASEQKRLAATAGDFADRDAALAERTGELDRRERLLEQTQQEVEQQREQLKTRLRDLRSAAEAVKGRETNADARQADIERCEQALNDRQEHLERIARETTTKLDRLVKGRQDLERRKRALKEIEKDAAARERDPANRVSAPHTSAAVNRQLPPTSDQRERPLGSGERLLQQREAELDKDLKRLLARSVELRQRRGVPVSSE